MQRLLAYWGCARSARNGLRLRATLPDQAFLRHLQGLHSLRAEDYRILIHWTTISIFQDQLTPRFPSIMNLGLSPNPVDASELTVTAITRVWMQASPIVRSCISFVRNPTTPAKILVMDPRHRINGACSMRSSNNDCEENWLQILFRSLLFVIHSNADGWLAVWHSKPQIQIKIIRRSRSRLSIPAGRFLDLK